MNTVVMDGVLVVFTSVIPCISKLHAILIQRYVTSVSDMTLWNNWIKRIKKSDLFSSHFVTPTDSGVNHQQESNLVVCYCSNYGKWLANLVCNTRKITKQFTRLPLLKNCCTRHTFCIHYWLLKSAVYSLCISGEQMAIRQPSYI